MSLKHIEILIASNLILNEKNNNLVNPRAAPEVFKWYFLNMEKGYAKIKTE